MFIVVNVREFPAWEPGEAAQLDEENHAYVSETPVSRWRDVAAASVTAATERPGLRDLEAWDAFGQSAGL